MSKRRASTEKTTGRSHSSSTAWSAESHLRFLSKRYRKLTATDWNLWFGSNQPQTIWSYLVQLKQDNYVLQRIPKCGIFSVHLKAYTFPRHFIEKSNHRNSHSLSDRQWITGEAIGRILQSTDIRVFFNSPNTIWRYMGSEIDTISFVNHGESE